MKSIHMAYWGIPHLGSWPFKGTCLIDVLIMIRFLTCFFTFLAIANSSRAGWPARVFAPYMYLGSGDNFKLTECDDACGQKFYTLAFIVSDKQGNPAWDGHW
ncbi:MAG TPA: hypothetical protein VH251_08790, partial [Verrucomicrobiae bacterium]|nr:hypothetical protein [Verrucomicrobiae bacterium]